MGSLCLVFDHDKRIGVLVWCVCKHVIWNEGLYFPYCPCIYKEACANGDLRLVGSALSTEGRVEVCVKGVWSTVCTEGWDNDDATVVCSQLGLITTGTCMCYLCL